MAPDRWLPFLGILFLLGALFKLPFLSTLSAALAVLISVTSLWRRYALDGIIYRRRPHYRRGFPGERVPLQLEVENRKLLPLSWLRIEDPWPVAIGPEEEDQLSPSHIPDHGFLTNVFSLRWFERTRRFYTLLLRDRGLYRVGPPQMQSGDLFGIYELTRKGSQRDFFTVYPNLLPFSALDLPADDPFGDRKSRRRLFEDPNFPSGVRDYRPEDSFRRIHWPATARTGSLQVKVYQPTSAKVVVVCLNVITFERHWEGFYPALLEQLVSVAATLIYEGIQDGYQVGLISNGSLAHSDRSFSVPPGRSPIQLPQLLQTLAAVTPMVTAPFERYLLREMPNVHYGASLMVVTAVTPPELIETLQELKRHRRNITLLSLAVEPPDAIPDVNMIHLPFEDEKEEVPLDL
ncbi:MAG: DUF58 domain-containing protein [Anaerolineales bacterium]|nr:DUF58 domain-containing protein [Anaerolineales bacterium]